jgi:hypothetical protein
LLATFKEPNPNKEIPTVDLTSDAGQPATTPAVFNRQPARAGGVFIREPARNATRVVVPIVEKGMQRVEAKNKGKRPIWQPGWVFGDCLRLMYQFVGKWQFLVFVLLVVGSMEGKNYVTVGCLFFVQVVGNMQEQIVVVLGQNLIMFVFCTSCW